MARYLTEQWLDRQAELASDLPERPGATARVQYVVTGAPDGDVTYHTVFENGRVVENTLGADEHADVVITVTYEDSLLVLDGELDANAAFMQGRLKSSGDTGKLMGVMPLTQSPEYRSVQATLAEQTER